MVNLGVKYTNYLDPDRPNWIKENCAKLQEFVYQVPAPSSAPTSVPASAPLPKAERERERERERETENDESVQNLIQ